MPLLVTIAVKLPVLVARFEKATVSEVDVAEITVPTADLLKTTELFAARGLKPTPVMTTVLAALNWAVVFTVTTGRMVAT